MKQVALFPILFFTLTLAAQQSEIHGIVSIHNSEYETGKRQYVQNAQVEDEFQKANAQFTGADGTFKLAFVQVAEKTSVNLIVKKEGLQVVNIDGLSAVTGQRDMVRLSMSKPEKIAEYRRQIYKIGKTEAEKNLAIQLKKKGEQIEILQKDVQKNKTDIEQLQKEYGELQAFASKIEEQAQDLARRYTPINLDDAAPLYREAFGYFQQGDLEKAMQILRGADLIGQADKILAERKAIGTIRQEVNQRDSLQQQRTKDLLQVLGLKADLHHAAFQFDSTATCFELMLSLDSMNVNTLWGFAYFLSDQREDEKAIMLYEKALFITKKDEIRASFLNNLGYLYRNNQKMLQAENAYKEALKIREKLAENSDILLFDVVMTLDNLGNFYRDNKKMQQSLVLFNTALIISQKLIEKNPHLALVNIALILNDLGNYYLINNRILEAETNYIESLKIYRQLEEKETETYSPDIAMVLNNLGNLYFDIKKMQKAETAFIEVLKIRRQLAKENPDKYLYNLANILNNLGNYYHGNQKEEEAETAFNEALDIKRELAAKNPDAYLPEVALILNNLGKLYCDNKKIQQAEISYSEALKIRRQLVEKNPDAYSSDLAITLNNIGVYYQTNKKVPQADTVFNEALIICRQLVKKNPDAFMPNLAATLNNLSLYYTTNEKNPQAEASSKEALIIYQQLKDINPDAYLPIIGNILDNQGFIYENINKISEAEAAYKESLEIRRQLENKNPGFFLANIASSLNHLGALYRNNKKMQQEEAAYIEALKIYRQLSEKKSNTFLNNVAFTLNNLGVLYKNLGSYNKALICYEEALGYKEIGIQKKGDHSFKSWEIVLNNISNVKDSALEKKEYENVIKAGLLLAQSYDKLKYLGNEILTDAVSEYADISWYALFINDYILVKKAVLRCIELDQSEYAVLINLGHSQLLRGKYTTAKAIYEQFKDKKDNEGEKYKETILHDFKALEAEGITHKDMPRMKAEIEKW